MIGAEGATMNIALSRETQRLLKRQMKRFGFATPDEAVRVALQTMVQKRGVDFEDLDQETQAALTRALAESDRGEGRPWEEVREEIRARFIVKKRA
jgi:Arc/MetJ-type ribon-helix-helix transcriptional regulator